MSIWDILLGRHRPTPSKLEALFAISTAQVSLEVKAGLRPGERAGICFRPVASSRFRALEAELRDLLKIGGRETGTSVELKQDSYGFQWVILSDPDFEDLVATTHMVSQTLHEEGFDEQLLAAVFLFLENSHRVYWIYNYKRGSFYPFVPRGSGRERDNARELHLSSLMERELPIEREIERWYPLWDLPL